jgi:DNA-binding HxlR family transcriptional regulator/putative sterol carrier protein
MSTRSYHQHCGLARALDLLGERWSLLVLRELALGPKRYRDLMDNLPGIGTNLLAARLRRLDEAGVIRRTTLPAPAGVPVYELTERGEQLRPVLEELALWGYQLLPETPARGDAFRASWAAMSMGAVLSRTGHGDLRGTFAFSVGEERFAVTVTDDGARVAQGTAPDADVRATADPATFFALTDGRMTAARAVREGGLTVIGDRRLLDRLLTGFHLPERAAA